MTADRRGEGFAFFHWHRYNRPLLTTCDDRFHHRYHLAFWRWGYR